MIDNFEKMHYPITWLEINTDLTSNQIREFLGAMNDLYTDSDLDLIEENKKLTKQVFMLERKMSIAKDLLNEVIKE
jgi:hypothetical protein